MNTLHLSLRLVAARLDGTLCRPLKRIIPSLFAGAVALAAGLAGPARAANIAAPGAGILGLKTEIDDTLGTLRFNAGVATNIIDGNLTTRVDNFLAADARTVSFVGVIWPVKHYETVSTLNLTLAAFGDGGWFGVPGALPPTGGALAATNLIEPVVQVTTNLGTNWITVGSTSDYQTVMLGHQIGGTGGQPNPNPKTSTFTLNTPATRINGIRIIGTNGGRTATDTNGFLGAIELAVNASPFEDVDGDGLADAWETEYGATSATDDLDADGLTNLQEFSADTNPNSADTDGDGLSDGFEVITSKTNPQLADTDGDGLSDGAEINTTLTNPLVADTDGDGLSDGAEVNVYSSNPLVRDTDGDGFLDGYEVARGHSPVNAANFPDNLAVLGKGIVGASTLPGGGIDTPYAQQGLTPAVLAAINDEILTTRLDTFNGNAAISLTNTASYVGILWTNQPLSVDQKVGILELTLALFGDGGWFGVNNTGPGAGGALVPSYLVEPVTQVSSDGGTTWVTVAHSSTYTTTALNGIHIGGGLFANPQAVTVRFTLATQPTGINGVRIIGTEGGTASRGFLGVFELTARVDSDNDGMADDWETPRGLVVGTDDSADDPDGDGLSNGQEYVAGTNPQNFDTDADGLADGDEDSTYLTNVLRADTDADGLIDGTEVNVTFTNPLVADTDGDGLTDGAEVNTYHTNPFVTDTDGDGFADGGEVAAGTDPNNPLNFPNNLALFSTASGILGTTNANGTDTFRYNAGTANNIRDNNLTTRVDNFGHPATDSNSFVGILWSQPITNVPIVSLELRMAIFLDGGWFGSNGIGPGAGGILSSANYLVAPIVQVTTNGTNWVTVDATNNYLDIMEGKRIGGGGQPNPTNYTINFTLTTPGTNLNGIRIVGPHGGTVSSSGFIGVFELKVRTAFDDTDNDGMDDAWERINGLTVGVNDAALDRDGDGLTNIQEYTRGTDPQLADTDGDGLSDSAEVNTYRTNPITSDSDADGLTDGAEVNTYHTLPLVRDTDGDGYSDGLEVGQGSNPLSSGSIPANLALGATAILGVATDITLPGTLVFNAGAGANINDGNPASRVDSFSALAATNSFVGLLWSQRVTNLARLEFNICTFFDGGWFGPNGVGPGSGGRLGPTYLIEPVVQVSANGGTNWETIGSTSDYLTVLDNHPLPAVDLGIPTSATVTFQFTTPQSNINGVRIIGSEGGTVGGGFLGVWELGARTTAGLRVTILNPTLVSGQIQFEFDSLKFLSHVVQYKNSLDDAVWQTLMTIPGDGTRKTVTDSTGNATRFYRVSTE